MASSTLVYSYTIISMVHYILVKFTVVGKMFGGPWPTRPPSRAGLVYRWNKAAQNETVLLYVASNYQYNYAIVHDLMVV